ncbi:MAG: hypothetical protein ACOC1P_05415 [Minisyncoccales bacterium]
MENLINKENKIFETLEELTKNNLEFIMVGGYAVSSYKHRFSIDADIVIQKKDLKYFENFLLKKEFKETYNKKLKNIYGSEFKRFENNDLTIDLMIGALASRQTDASFSYEFLKKHSSKRKIIGIEKEISVLIPRKEILIITKLHSARLTDFRDIAALAKNSDVEFIQKFLFRGNVSIVERNLSKLNQTVNEKNFVDSFKGVFIEKKFDVDLAKVKEISLLINR